MRPAGAGGAARPCATQEAGAGRCKCRGRERTEECSRQRFHDEREYIVDRRYLNAVTGRLTGLPDA